MNRTSAGKRAALMAVWAAASGLLIAACSDFGGSTVVPCDDGSPNAPTDATTPLETGGGGARVPDSGDARSATDSSNNDAGASDTNAASALDSTATDAAVASDDSAVDSTLSSPDSNAPDTSTIAPDVGTIVETGVMDSTVPDTGAPDTGGSDVTVADAVSPDTGQADSAVRDTGPADSARTDVGTAETGVDSAGGSTTACTVAPCSASGPNSAKCSGSPNGVCTPTQAIVMNYDIAHNGQGPGAPIALGCYMCMITNACLDADGTTNTLGTAVTNAECGDPDVPPPANPPFASRNVSATNTAKCIDAFTCLLTGNGGAEPHCTTTAPSPPSISNCFCGTNRGSTCIASPSAPNGICAAREVIDLGTTDPTTALSHYVDTTYSPGGVGNAILNCAQVAGSSFACAGLPCFK